MVSTKGRIVVARTVKCVKLQREADALERAPYPGDIGKKILDNVSKEAWAMWLQHQTILINEYRLTPIEAKDRKFLEDEMEKFFFDGGSDRPSDYVDPNN